MTPLRRIVFALGATMLGVLAVLSTPTVPAYAHAGVVSTSPGSGAVLAAAPTEVLVVFSEDVQPVATKIRVTGPNGQRADTGEPTVKGATLRIPLRPGGARGSYLVSYRVISNDSHPVGGGFSYAVGAPSAVAAAGTDAGRVNPAVAIAMAVAHYLGFAGLVLLAGPILAILAFWPTRLPRQGPIRLARIAVATLILGTIAELYLQVPYSTGANLTGATGAELVALLGERYGQAHLVRLVALLAATALLNWTLTGRGGRTDQVLLIVLAAVGLGTWPAAGHASTSPAPALTVVADMAHLAGMAAWLGGLIMLVLFLLPRGTPRELAAIGPVWARWAGIAVATVVLSGTVRALVEIGTPTALLNTTYGRLVLAKTGLLAIVLAIAAYSRKLVLSQPEQPPSDKKPAPSVRLRRAIVAELAIAAVVLSLSSALVLTTPARVAETNARTAFGSANSMTLTSPLYSLQVDIDPGAVGQNDVHLYAYRLDGSPLPVREWKVSAALPAQGIEPVTVTLTALADNHNSGQVALPVPGDWEFSFTLRISEIDQATVTRTVRIKP